MNDQLQRDWEEFNGEDHQVPGELNSTLQKQILKRLTPPKSLLFLKLAVIQAFIGTLTLTFCPQFELSLTSNDQLYHFFHHTFGYFGCVAVCGALFLGSGMIFAGMVLNEDEIRGIRKNRSLFISAISGMSLIVFLMMGAQVYLDISLFWIIGTMTGGILSFETSTWIKIKALKTV